MVRGSALIAACALVGTLAGCGESPAPQHQDALYAYTCCGKSDIEQAWRPGAQVAIGWAAEERPGTRSGRARYVVLSARLTGPYGDASALKRGSPAAVSLEAPDVIADTWQPQRPVSLLTLPADLSPGLYNLCFREDYSAGNGVSGCSIVQVGKS